ncbi:phosphatidylinositol-specific phospholipase C [Streptomyces sp. NBC_00690]|uniref:phosphatidylinositol-specific phospholipase C n=1 Tax=Streptomyces sp. NBC_00690 TaxID=2975808 RepID=UPI002E2B87D5|nr:phosphatidylinositol-specific phospholipase C [Streptomyces sp. NBC_00690]
MGVGAAAGAAALGLPNVANAASWSSRNWMSSLPDSRSLTRMTIPGTHDTCSNNANNGTMWAKCHNWSIWDQLERGIRFVDIRLNGLQGTANEMGVYHGSWYQDIRYQDVLNACDNHLRNNPREVIIMRVKNENAGGQALGAAEFRRRFNFYLDHPSMNFRPRFWTNPSWPTLGQARGKIVLVADFANPWTVLQWSSGWNSFFRTQDIWDGNGQGIQFKRDKIIEWFDHAYFNQNAAEMYVNHTSYANGVWPSTNASNIFPTVRYYLDQRKTQRINFGIVPMDFPDYDTEVLRLLIDKNFI